MTDLISLFRHAMRALLAILLLVCGFAAVAQDAKEVSRLIKLGQYGAAMEKIEATLAKNPKDAQARFLKGLVLTEQGKTNDAIATFQSLSEDYPELPEPYNNLASLYAAKGQFEKARTALEMAIQVNPGYATAYENLGDIYAKLASQAYDKALQLDKANTTAQGKLASVRNAFAATATKPAASAPATVPPTKGEAPKPAAMASVSAPVASVSVPVASAQPAVAVAAGSPRGGDAGAVLAAVNAWASAWSARNVDQYLAAYSKGFVPEGKTREEWESARRTSFPAAKTVQVAVNQPQVSMVGDNQAQVTFVQHFRSGRVKLNTRKILLLAREDGAWHIARERIVH